MKINITSRHFKASDSLKESIVEQLNSLKKFNDEIVEANVVLSFTHLKDSIKETEVILKIPGKVITVTESTDDFIKSISGATDKLVRQLKKHKTKEISKRQDV